jgi:hypothetical protein
MTSTRNSGQTTFLFIRRWPDEVARRSSLLPSLINHALNDMPRCYGYCQAGSSAHLEILFMHARKPIQLVLAVLSVDKFAVGARRASEIGGNLNVVCP